MAARRPHRELRLVGAKHNREGRLFVVLMTYNSVIFTALIFTAQIKEMNEVLEHTYMCEECTLVLE